MVETVPNPPGLRRAKAKETDLSHLDPRREKVMAKEKAKARELKALRPRPLPLHNRDKPVQPPT